MFPCNKVAQKIGAASVFFKKLPKGINSPRLFRKFALSGADVMITIFCDFRQFSAKKLAFFSKTNVMIKIFYNLALF
jgi:hypothetical protein